MGSVDAESHACETQATANAERRTIDDYFPALIQISDPDGSDELEHIFSQRVDGGVREIVQQESKCSTCGYDLGANNYWLVNRPEKDHADGQLTDFVFEYCLGDCNKSVVSYYVALIETEKNRCYSFVVVVADRERGAVYHYVDDHDIGHHPEEFREMYVSTRCFFLKKFVHGIFEKLKQEFGDCEEDYLLKRTKWDLSVKAGFDVGMDEAVREFKQMLLEKKMHPYCCSRHSLPKD